MRILICDDSRFVLSLYETRLKSEGFSITGKATDGDQCLRLFQETKPDLVLLDITMPNKDGRATLTEILALQPGAKVIMISGVSEKAVVNECMKAGAHDYVLKTEITSEEDFKKNLIQKIKTLHLAKTA
jgi:two-component system, chemotaxis family, chemotaxis protein CheY